MGTTSPLSHAAAPGSATQPLRQEIPLYLELSNLLVELGHQAVSILLAAGFTAKDTGGSLVQGFLPGTYLAGVDLVAAGPLGYCLFPPWGFPRPPGPERPGGL